MNSDCNSYGDASHNRFIPSESFHASNNTKRENDNDQKYIDSLDPNSQAMPASFYQESERQINYINSNDKIDTINPSPMGLPVITSIDNSQEQMHNFHRIEVVTTGTREPRSNPLTSSISNLDEHLNGINYLNLIEIDSSSRSSRQMSSNYNTKQSSDLYSMENFQYAGSQLAADCNFQLKPKTFYPAYNHSGPAVTNDARSTIANSIGNYNNYDLQSSTLHQASSDKQTGTIALDFPKKPFFDELSVSRHFNSEERSFIEKNNQVLKEQYLNDKDLRYTEKKLYSKDQKNHTELIKDIPSKRISNDKLSNGYFEPKNTQRSGGSTFINKEKYYGSSRLSNKAVYSSSDKSTNRSRSKSPHSLKYRGQAFKGVKRKAKSPLPSRPIKHSAELSKEPNVILKTDSENQKLKIGINERNDLKDSTAVKLDNSPKSKDGTEVNEHDTESTPWIRSSPADLYYKRDPKNPMVITATDRLIKLCEKFDDQLCKRASRAREKRAKDREQMDLAKNDTKVNTGTCNEAVNGLDGKLDNVKVDEQLEGELKKNTLNDNGNVSCDTPDKSCIEGKNSSQCSSSKDSVICNHSKSTKREKSNKSSKSSNKSKSKKLNCCNSKEKSLQKNVAKKRAKCLSDCSSSDSEELNQESTSSSSSCASEDEDEWGSKGLEEMEKKKKHPDRMHEELWYNDPGEMNDYPLCRCSLKARLSGIKHGYYVGETPLNSCDMWTNNADKLHHYFITISPPTNFLVKSPTIITYDSHEFIFEGFSLLSHFPLDLIPTCQVIRFNIEYSVTCTSETMPDNFCVKELNMFYDYIFNEILELVDLNLNAIGDEEGCPRFHFLPRFVRKLPDSGKEVLSMNEVLNFLLKSSVPLVKEEDIAEVITYSEREWLNYTDQVKGMIVTYPGKKPCSIRVDQLDREQLNDSTINYPVIVHFGIRPPQLSYAGNPLYQKALREYGKFHHLLANMPKPSYEHKRQLEAKENRLQAMRMANSMKKEVTVDISAEGFYRTGIMCDIVQHALLIPVLVRHLRFHHSLTKLEESINYRFRNRYLLQLALTHPSYRENFGTNPDHARNALTNCGVRQPQYGDKNIQYVNTHKRGINTLVNIMSRFGKEEESESKITHNERLEFLGDAVVEFLSSIHLFHLFPSLEEGGLATYRAALVQNQHLSVLAGKLELDKYVLHAHGSDLCHTFALRHAMANCFEALMGAIFIDSGIEFTGHSSFQEADSVFSETLFKNEPELLNVWVNYKPHPLQEQEPDGDRKWIETFPVLQKLVKFEESIGIQFRHIRLLARCFTDRSIGFNYLTLGSNQRLEFLGDTVLQLIASEYLYKHFPEHHEGHLSLLRSSLVNNRTQAVVCNDLNMTEYAIYSKLKSDLKTKDRADLLEAFLGALYIDQGLDHCRKFCDVCFFPRLQQFIVNQEWNDPKSKLQQCCLTLRSMAGGNPDIPVYKVIECKGPTNTRVYTVAVYFRNKRLSRASGHSIQWAEMLAAENALLNTQELFPHLAYQKKLIAKNVQQSKKIGNRYSAQRRNFMKKSQRDASESYNKNILPSSSCKSRDNEKRSNRIIYNKSDKPHGSRSSSEVCKSPLKGSTSVRPITKTQSTPNTYSNKSQSMGQKYSSRSIYQDRKYVNKFYNNSESLSSIGYKGATIRKGDKFISQKRGGLIRSTSLQKNYDDYKYERSLPSMDKKSKELSSSRDYV